MFWVNSTKVKQSIFLSFVFSGQCIPEVVRLITDEKETSPDGSRCLKVFPSVFVFADLTSVCFLRHSRISRQVYFHIY